MPIVNVTTWPTLDDAKKRRLLEGLTSVVHEVTGAPLDKIVTYIVEVNQSAWAEAGVVGSDSSFPELSRRRAYANDSLNNAVKKEVV